MPSAHTHSQRANVAPAVIMQAKATNAVNAITPNTGFGIPNSSACSDAITDEQLNIGFMLQLGAKSGFLATSIVSRNKATEANSPHAPRRVSAIPTERDDIFFR